MKLYFIIMMSILSTSCQEISEFDLIELHRITDEILDEPLEKEDLRLIMSMLIIEGYQDELYNLEDIAEFVEQIKRNKN